MKIPACLYLLIIATGIAVLLVSLGPPVAAQNPPAGTPPQTKGGPITQPQIASIAYNTYFINEFGMDSQYVLIGGNRALLIDTGWGFYDIKGTVESLTNLPYDVVITHSHHDHAGMIGNFDTVYMYKAEATSDRSKVDEKPRKEKPSIPDSCRYIWDYADPKWKGDKRPTIKPLNDGQIFDLGGGRVVTVYYVPGHTLDSCAFLDRKTRILFSGDVLLPTVDIHGTKGPTAISTRLRGWIRLQRLGAEYDRIFYGHTNRGCGVSVKPLDPDVLGNLIEVYRQALRGDAKFEKVANPNSPRKYRAVWKNVAADVELDNLWEPGEPHIVP